LCEVNQEQRAEAKIQALRKSVDDNVPNQIKPSDVLKLINC